MLVVFVEEFGSDFIVVTLFPLDAERISFPKMPKSSIIRDEVRKNVAGPKNLYD